MVKEKGALLENDYNFNAIAWPDPALTVERVFHLKGSGFLLTASGLVVTNYHVINDANSFEVRFPSRDILKRATVKMKDKAHDGCK